MIKTLLIILVILAVLFLIGGGYFLGMSYPLGGASPTPMPSVETISTPAPSPSLTTEASASSQPQMGQPTNTKEEVIAAFASGNYDGLNNNLADKVSLIINSSDCCQASSDPTEILKFISSSVGKGTGPWLFNSDDPKYAPIANSSDFFATDKTGKAIAFDVDADGNLKSVIFYADYRLAGN